MSAVYFDERTFADKVMARVSAEPTPTLTGATGSALRHLNPQLLLGVSWTAWHLATARTKTVRPQLRFKSAALLSVMLLMLAMGTTFAAAGAVAVVQEVTQQFAPAHSAPRGPEASAPANHGGTVPAASQLPRVTTSADPSAAPAGAQPPAGVGDPNPGNSPGDEDGNGNGQGDNGNGQGNDPSPTPTASPHDNGGKGTHPSPTPGDDGQGDDNGGGNDQGGDQGGGDGTHASPTPTPSEDDQGGNQGDGQDSGGGDGNSNSGGNSGNGGNGSDHNTGGQDSGNGGNGDN